MGGTIEWDALPTVMELAGVSDTEFVVERLVIWRNTLERFNGDRDLNS